MFKKSVLVSFALFFASAFPALACTITPNTSENLGTGGNNITFSITGIGATWDSSRLGYDSHATFSSISADCSYQCGTATDLGTPIAYSNPGSPSTSLTYTVNMAISQNSTIAVHFFNGSETVVETCSTPLYVASAGGGGGGGGGSGYTVNPTDAASIHTMGISSTGTFLNLFTSNWPTIATFAITIMGFFFIWNLLKGFFKKKSMN